MGDSMRLFLGVWFAIGSFIGGACAFVFLGAVFMAALFSTSMLLSEAFYLIAPFIGPLALFGGCTALIVTALNFRS